ncbi:hypothetical protein [Dietzia maris]|uniref:hypothetical protein n=1 Tax=Dietzia maris TaxID=37915 RepID=UPI0037C9E055
MIEWSASALGIAGSLLRHFLDGPERELRKEKLQLEIDALSSRVDCADQEMLLDLRNSVLGELERLSDKIPELSLRHAPSVGPSLVRHGDAQTAILRLDQALESFRNENVQDGLSGMQTQNIDAPSEAESSPVEWAELPPAASPQKSAVEIRLESLQSRIDRRRREDQS